MTGHPFGVWLDSDRTGPVPEPAPEPVLTSGAAYGQYWLSADHGGRYGLIHLWCHLCTAGGDDYIGEWLSPVGDEYEGEVSAKVRAHQADKHTEPTQKES